MLQQNSLECHPQGVSTLTRTLTPGDLTSSHAMQSPKVVYDISLDVFLRLPSPWRVLVTVQEGQVKRSICTFDGLRMFLRECVEHLFAIPEGRPAGLWSPSMSDWGSSLPAREAKASYLKHAGCRPKVWVNPVLCEIRKITNHVLIYHAFMPFFALLDGSPEDPMDRRSIDDWLKTVVRNPNPAINTSPTHARARSHTWPSKKSRSYVCISRREHRETPSPWACLPTTGRQMCASGPGKKWALIGCSRYFKPGTSATGCTRGWLLCTCLMSKASM